MFLEVLTVGAELFSNLRGGSLHLFSLHKYLFVYTYTQVYYEYCPVTPVGLVLLNLNMKYEKRNL